VPRRLQPVHIFCVSIGALGIALLGVLVAVYPPHLVQFSTFSFWALAVSVLLGELLPIEIPRMSGDGEVTVSTMFSFALLLSVGLVPALVAQLAASAIQDLMAGKRWWRVGFNMGQYAITLAIAAMVLALVVGHQAPLGSSFSVEDLLAVGAAAGAFFVVNLLLVTRATTYHDGTPIISALKSDLIFSLSVGAVLLCFAPAVVTVLDFSPALFPLLFMPLLAVYSAGRQAVRMAKAEHQATHDSLTELPNRRWFREEVARALAEPGSKRAAILLVDLNRFKEVNDTLGHHHGDLVLRQVGPRLEGAFRESDIVARLGGDEFAVFMPNVSESQAAHSAVQRFQMALKTPIEADGISIELDASVGVAWYPDHGDDVDTLLQRADVAMYRAKATHADWERYDEAHDHHSPAKLALMSDLRNAIDNGQIIAHYQPVLDLRTGRVDAVEALVRWNHPDLGLLAPGAFLEMAEHTSLIKPLTRRVIDTSLRQLAEWQALGLDMTMSVNISVRSLLDPAFPGQVAEALAEVDISPSLVKLEITESTIMADPRVAKRVLDELSAMGLTLSIDDFGTGYSSLAYLKDLPVDEVKIDRSFVMNMGKGDSDAVIVRSTIDLGHHLGLQVVGEGVEDEAALERLRELRCDRAQGYFISRPTPGRDLTAWLLTHPVVGMPTPADTPSPASVADWRAA
jgi:diguanylate cyclase (GGDEF)-like protein